MSTVVTDADSGESPEGATPEAEAEVTPEATESIETWRKRLAGKDQALTRTKAERDALAAETEALRRWKAEKENADLSEVERLQRQVEALAAERDTAKAEAARIALERRYPLAFGLLGDAAPLDADRLEDIEQKLSQRSADEPEAEPRVDPNNPRRPAVRAGKSFAEMSGNELAEVLRVTPVPEWG